jgi:hypothetical protein
VYEHPCRERGIRQGTRFGRSDQNATRSSLEHPKQNGHYEEFDSLAEAQLVIENLDTAIFTTRRCDVKTLSRRMG